MLQKIRKNKDSSDKYGHFLEMRTVLFSKTYYCKTRTNLRNKDGMVALSIRKPKPMPNFQIVAYLTIITYFLIILKQTEMMLYF